MTFDGRVTEKLVAPLNPARIQHREGSGGRSLSYLEGHDVIRAANDIFGIGGWSYAVQTLDCVGSEQVEKTYNGQKKLGWHVAYRATVRVEVGVDGPIYSDVGFGDAVEYTGSALTPHELASKEAVTDGLKRALKNLGDQFGLCLYDKSYVPGAVVPSAAAGTGAGAPQTPAPTKDSGAHKAVASGVGDVTAPAAGATGLGGAPAATFTWASGKHQGKSLEDTDRSYIEWYAEKGPKEDVRAVCNAFLLGEELVAVGATEFTGDDDIPF